MHEPASVAAANEPASRQPSAEGNTVKTGFGTRFLFISISEFRITYGGGRAARAERASVTDESPQGQDPALAGAWFTPAGPVGHATTQMTDRQGCKYIPP